MEQQATLMGTEFRSAGLSLYGLDAVFGVRFGILYSTIISDLRNKLVEAGICITPKQVSILWLVNANPNINQENLGRFLNIARASVHQFVAILVDRNFLTYSDEGSIRKIRGLLITELGKEALKSAQVVVEDHEIGLLKRWSDKDRKALDQLLGRLLSERLPVKHELVGSSFQNSIKKESA